MSSLKFKQTSGPHGDAMSNYDVTSEARNVKDFVLEVLTDNKNEWGVFYIDRKYEYNRGKLLNNIPENILHSEIVYPVKANGGWSLMSYWITLK